MNLEQLQWLRDEADLRLRELTWAAFFGDNSPRIFQTELELRADIRTLREVAGIPIAPSDEAVLVSHFQRHV